MPMWHLRLRTDMNEKISKVLKMAGVGANVKNISRLHGDASNRIYYRVKTANGRTYVVMQMPQGKSSVSEEITNFKGPKDELPFINVARFLSGLNLSVPQIYYYDKEERLMILEDVGDDILWGHVSGASREQQERWYKKAIDFLVDVQTKTQGASGCIALQRSFDATLLNWEFDHFREYFIEEQCGQKMRLAHQKIFEDVTRKITNEILRMPYCFTHRDFQSRNLMVKPDDLLVMLDFQDALMGPYVYDLVALLRDSYVELDWDLAEGLIQYYNEKSAQLTNSQTHKLTNFHLVTLQRKMKDAGRFIYIDRVKKNPGFLQYIPATLRYIENAFKQTQKLQPLQLRRADKNSKTHELFEMLQTYVPEWK